MTLEDFTTFTEVDPFGRISYTANHIDFDCARDEDAYLYKDYGVDALGNFEHYLDVRLGAFTPYSFYICWVLSNNVDDYKGLLTGNKTAIGIRSYLGAGAPTRNLYISELYGGTEYLSNYYVISPNVTYYLVLRKVGDVLTGKIYSDPARTILLATLTLTLHANHKFRYILIADSYNDGMPTIQSGDIDNLELFPIVQTLTTMAWGKSTVTVGVITSIRTIRFGYGATAPPPPPAEGMGESALGIAWNLWIYNVPNKQWNKGGTLNPSGTPTNDIGIQWGLEVWASGQRRWLRGGAY